MTIPKQPDIRQEEKYFKRANKKEETKREEVRRRNEFKENFPCYGKYMNKDECKNCPVKGSCKAKTTLKNTGIQTTKTKKSKTKRSKRKGKGKHKKGKKGSKRRKR